MLNMLKLYLSCFFSECIKPSDNCINETNEIDRDKDELEQEVEKDPLHAFILNRTTTTMRRQYNRNCILCYTFGILRPIALNTLPPTPDASFGLVTITFKIHFVCVNRQWRGGVHERKSYLSIRILWIVVHCICGSVCGKKGHDSTNTRGYIWFSLQAKMWNSLNQIVNGLTFCLFLLLLLANKLWWKICCWLSSYKNMHNAIERGEVEVQKKNDFIQRRTKMLLNNKIGRSDQNKMYRWLKVITENE